VRTSAPLFYIIGLEGEPGLTESAHPPVRSPGIARKRHAESGQLIRGQIPVKGSIPARASLRFKNEEDGLQEDMAELPVVSSRSGGVLCHPTSLPGPFGIGDLGPGARGWIEWLSAAGCSTWQVLPLGPTGYANSPYQSFSSVAGNHLLISLEDLVLDGLFESGDLAAFPDFPAAQVDYGRVIAWKESMLRQAAERFFNAPGHPLLDEFKNFGDEHRSWLEDYAVFMALKAFHEQRPWVSWTRELRTRDEGALHRFKEEHTDEIRLHRLWQFLFFRQWGAIRRLARARGITIIGDIPIFVAHDSVDVWSHPDNFYLDHSGNPTVIAGVPPDYFSRTGQRWGNPLYRWDRMAEEGFGWWIHRFRTVLQMVDLVRLDHFRGFEAYWEIPVTCPTAEEGRWVKGPGDTFLSSVKYHLGSLPVIAEDLGVITPEVIALRDGFGLPGMKILQFGLEGGAEDPFLPHHYDKNCIAYTGTHDNDTSRGWYEAAPEYVRDFSRRYLASDGEQIAWEMMRAIWASVAMMAIAPLQDVLGLDSRSRMNYPSRIEDNWEWRVEAEALTDGLAAQLLELNQLFRRV
jgi:4-alpha-glucanotransferase